MLFLDDGNVIFSAALLLMLMLAVMEGALALIGLGISSAIDSLLPDFDLDADAPTSSGWSASGLLGWLRFGQLPALIILIVFLTCFGLTGLLLQYLVHHLVGTTLPSWLAVIAVLMLSLPQVRFLTGILSKIAIRDETESISREQFIGRTARITLGIASPGQPAEAKFTDQFGTTHYVMVEPESDESFQQGEDVLIYRENGSTFKVIKPEDLYSTTF